MFLIFFGFMMKFFSEQNSIVQKHKPSFSDIMQMQLKEI